MRSSTNQAVRILTAHGTKDLNLRNRFVAILQGAWGDRKKKHSCTPEDIVSLPKGTDHENEERRLFLLPSLVRNSNFFSHRSHAFRKWKEQSEGRFLDEIDSPFSTRRKPKTIMKNKSIQRLKSDLSFSPHKKGMRKKPF